MTLVNLHQYSVHHDILMGMIQLASKYYLETYIQYKNNVINNIFEEEKRHYYSYEQWSLTMFIIAIIM